MYTLRCCKTLWLLYRNRIIYREIYIIMIYIKKEIFFKSMHQPNTLFYMEIYCGGICQCYTTNIIFLIEVDNFKIYVIKKMYNYNWWRKKISSPNYGKRKKIYFLSFELSIISTIMSVKLRVCALKYIYVYNVYTNLLKFIVKWLVIVRAFINEWWCDLYFNVRHWTLISRWLSEKLTASNDMLK